MTEAPTTPEPRHADKPTEAPTRSGLRFVPLVFLIIVGGAILFPIASHDTIYPPGTTITAPANSPIALKSQYDRTYVYRVPTGAIVHYDSGKSDTVEATFELTDEPKDETPFPIAMDTEKPGALAGAEIAVPENVLAKSHHAAITWATFVVSMAIPCFLLAIFYGRRIRVGRWIEAAILWCILMAGAASLGTTIDRPDAILNSFRQYFDVPAEIVAVEVAAAIIAYILLFCVIRNPGVPTATAKKQIA